MGISLADWVPRVSLGVTLPVDYPPLTGLGVRSPTPSLSFFPLRIFWVSIHTNYTYPQAMPTLHFIAFAFFKSTLPSPEDRYIFEKLKHTCKSKFNYSIMG
jgi:hypothetical protein